MTDDHLRLALDVGVVAAQPAGVGLYVARLAAGLAGLIPDELPAGGLALIGVRDTAAELASLPANIARRPFRTPTYQAWVQLAAERAARSAAATLVHYTNAVAPLAARLPYVLTVHDLSIARHPTTHPIRRWPLVPLNVVSLGRARAIIVPSRWTARELGRLGVSERRIVVIPHAPTLAPSAVDALVLDRLAIRPREYVLFVGTLEPRKNIVRLIGAFEAFAADKPQMHLVLAGAPGWRHAGISRRIAGSPLRERIHVTGYLAAAELATLVARSACVAYVSLYEGFGMPVLDALALGVPVVASRTTAMPESGSAGAVLVDPYDEGAIAAGLATAVRERSVGSVTRSWMDVAREHLAVYRHALAHH